MTDHKERPKSEELLAARQEFLQMFKRGAEFSEELLKENERLRFRLAEVEARPSSGDRDGQLVREMLEKIQRLEQERQDLSRRFKEVEAENKDFAARYVEVENENNNLLNIYVASYQLHSTLDFQEVLQIITEIVLNFVGAEVFSISLVDDKGAELKALVSEGMTREAMGAAPSGQGVIGGVMQSGDPYFNKDTTNLQPETIAAEKPLVCIPLKIKDKVIGVICLYRFLPQKKRLAHVDYELFTLLAGHAATAIFSAKLYTESRRKLNTIQGLIDLVTS
jgi:hypothetical protein